MIPFLVADRPASLQIIRGLKIPKNKKVGLMSHANTTKNFKEIYAKFPCSNRRYCEVTGRPCKYNGNIYECKRGKHFSDRLIRIADSGVFTKEGCAFPSYNNLYQEYEKMNVDFGIMIDYLKDKKKTIESANVALDIYESHNWNFKIIGVAQGNSLEEYLDSYVELRDMGFRYIAIGGLLKKKVNTARYVQVRDEDFLWSVFFRIREIDSQGWIFALGCYGPSRHNRFLKLKVYGSDYKGWIFQYKNKYPNAKRGNISAKKSRYQQVRRFIRENIFNKDQEIFKRN